MEVLALLGIIGIIVLFLAAESYQKNYTWPIARGRLSATWPMYPSKEGFANITLEQWLPSPEVVTKPSVGDCPGTLMNAAGYDGQLKIKNYDLLNDVLPSNIMNRVAKGPTSEKCYNVDYGRSLELSSYSQRTNNYMHKTPESCSAQNHDLILNFYN